MAEALDQLDEFDERPIDKHKYAPERATLENVGLTYTIPEDVTDAERAEAEEVLAGIKDYLAHFVAPIRDESGARCFHCGEYLTGMMAAILSRGGGFTWGIAHGEGFCGNCRWPAAGHHFAKGFFTLHNYVLSYHPDYVGHGTAQGTADD